ncbi:VCBS repeat-containing protein [Rickettsiales endosymbiont of Peranema trichophorum]|uniref:FG-GAP repeat domain-containing protein n=1 Tax=Rickettsiales endosymbiont of Peranema trichophorum TaxID=2486577 RepID=UPI0010237980|nr:VCBS repeat-containing protein [Rickettsiales endosymbiont of Peranema trichophorum]RZI47550.1 VCBS repeat-containing protein [Rickettsiales endosymbiont of Peranema trichophorum]
MKNSNFVVHGRFSPAPGYAVGANNYKYLVGDFNGDGKSDLVHLCCPNNLRAWLSSGDGTFAVKAPFSPGDGRYGVDLNNYKYIRRCDRWS